MSDLKLFDYSRLRGKIKEVCDTQSNLAKSIGLSKVSLSLKLNNKIEFSQVEIFNICNVLKIPEDEISRYFLNCKGQ